MRYLIVQTINLARIQFLAEIAAADGVRQYTNYVTCVELKAQTRTLTVEPCVRIKLAAIQWPKTQK